MKDLMNDLTNYKTLDADDARQLLTRIANGEYNESQIASILTVFMMRDVTVAELRGFREAMLNMCIKVDLEGYQAIDLCGTGGDGKDTFNISTLSAFVVAAAGQKVAKHGNNGVSSVCGSSNLLLSLGHEFKGEQNELVRDLEVAGICFLHAPLFHPAMKNVAPVRKALGVKTFFNMLGPLVNPSLPKSQMTGVFDLELARLYGYLLQGEPMNYSVLHSLDGYDEISLTGRFKVISNQGEKIYHPSDLGFEVHQPQQLFGGDTIDASTKIFERIIKGDGTKAQNEVVIANAGFALHTANNDLTLEEAVAKAEETLMSGLAYKCLKKLIDKKTAVAVSTN